MTQPEGKHFATVEDVADVAPPDEPDEPEPEPVPVLFDQVRENIIAMPPETSRRRAFAQLVALLLVVVGCVWVGWTAHGAVCDAEDPTVEVVEL